MYLSKPLTFITSDAPAMHRICTRIAKRRQSEANVMPAPEGWPEPKAHKPSLFPRLCFLAVLLFHLAVWIFWLALNSAVTP